MPRSLNKAGMKRIVEWLEAQGIQTTALRLHRDLSDGIKVAKMLKKFYPRLVNMNNYPKRMSTTLKKENWNTLNFKVLKKVGLAIGDKRMARIAAGEKGAIDFLLYHIMLKDYEFRLKRKGAINPQEKFWLEHDDVVIANVKFWEDGEISEKPTKLILYAIYKEKLLALEEQTRKIDAVRQQVAHIENLRKLQEEQAQEIRGRLRFRYGPSYVYEKVDCELVPALDLKEIVKMPKNSSASSADHSPTLRAVVSDTHERNTMRNSLSKCTI